MSDEPHVLRNLRTLKDAGVTIAIDDFGTHYSSLAYLKRFPIDILKVDSSFIENLPADEDSAAIASAILALAQSLRLQTIAEGVETEAQAAFLAERGTDVLQGWLFAKAMPADECRQWLASRQVSAHLYRVQTQA